MLSLGTVVSREMYYNHKVYSMVLVANEKEVVREQQISRNRILDLSEIFENGCYPWTTSQWLRKEFSLGGKIGCTPIRAFFYPQQEYLTL